MKEIEKSIIGHVVDAYESLDAAIGLLEDLLQDDADEELTQPGEEALDEEETQVAGEDDANPGIFGKMDSACRPCPFCKDNKDGVVVVETGEDDTEEWQAWYVQCNRCNATGPEAQNKAEAIWAWNGFSEEK